MHVPELKSFSLVGGTALALKFGHRKSVDLDFFSPEQFDVRMMQTVLEREFGAGVQFEHTTIGFAVFCEISNVKIDIIHYPHPIIAPVETRDEIRLLSNIDIAAMKVSAILGRGVKKDFWDMAELLSRYTLEEIVGFYALKFPSQMLLISVSTALTYFDDADQSEEPVSLKGQTWEKVKSFIQKQVRGYLL